MYIYMYVHIFKQMMSTSGEATNGSNAKAARLRASSKERAFARLRASTSSFASLARAAYAPCQFPAKS